MDGHLVQTASDGPSGLSTVESQSFDVILLDIGLPFMNGFELVKVLRARLSPHPFFIALTGYGRDEDREATAAAGFDAHLTKPFRPDDLARLLMHASVVTRNTQNHPEISANPIESEKI